MASRAIGDMKNSDLDKPVSVRPVLKKDRQDRNRADPEFKIECEDYSEDSKEYQIRKGRREEIQPAEGVQSCNSALPSRVGNQAHHIAGMGPGADEP